MKPTAEARISEIQVQPPEVPSQSLLCCLDAVLKGYGCRVDRDELAVVLGDAVQVTHAAEARPGEQWNVYGRHAFLESAARLYGLELRDLHPPGAAPLPVPPPEFVGHFADSYLPLVRAALAHGYPALAWMGWPAPNRTGWGIITSVDVGGPVVGRTPFSEGRTVVLEGPPVQVYTVQEFQECRLSFEQVLNIAFGHTAAVLNNQIPSNYRVVTGVAALEKWRDEAEPQAGVAVAMIAGRSSAARFFRRIADRHPSAGEYAAIFEEQIGILTALADEDGNKKKIDRVIELERLAAAIGPTRQ